MPHFFNLIPDPRKILNRGIEYPLRRAGDLRRFFLSIVLAPLTLTAGITALCGYFLFPYVPAVHHFVVLGVHIVALLIFQGLLWTPNFLAIFDGSERFENLLMYARNIILALFVMLLFPHNLTMRFFREMDPALDLNLLYIGALVVVILGYQFLAAFNLKRTASRDIRAGTSPQARKYSERWLWFDTLTLFLIFFGVIVIELWFLATVGRGEFCLNPTRLFEIPAKSLLMRMEMLTWFCCGVASGLLFFLWACIGHRLMSSVLISVTFHERDVRGVVFRSPHYVWHFAVAMLLKNPVILPGGLIVTFSFFAAPIFFFAAKQYQLLDTITSADQVVLAIGIFFAWFGPITKAAVHPDSTFAEYFNQRLESLVLLMQGHLLLFGYGNLGKRVLRREIRQLLKEDKKNRFMEVVTPDVRLETLCSHGVVVEQDPCDLVFSANSELLGKYGVVATHERSYLSMDPQGRVINPEMRVLVPSIVGRANEPVVSSRVNLERARVIISTVPDEESVQEIFDRADRANVRSIICVSRGDQVSYLTYRARYRQIVLVYPKQSQGNTLGHRVWAAMHKVRAVKSSREWPRVLVIGNNKANHYMFETLYTYLPGDHFQKTACLEKSIALILLEAVVADYPTLPEERNGAFTHVWEERFVTGGRFPSSVDKTREHRYPQLKARIINEADNAAIEACIRDHQPDILILDHDDMALSMLLARTIRSLERLKAQQGFVLPLLMLSTMSGDTSEQLRIGDYSRYYDALCRLYGEKLALDPGYPVHARYAGYSNELKGGTITDALADSEEIIASARRSLVNLTEGAAASDGKSRFVEINSCLANRPGALADFLARLANLTFNPLGVDYSLRQVDNGGEKQVYLPSFHYLRNIIQEDGSGGHYLTGYAALCPVAEDSLLYQPADLRRPAARMFVSDGRNYPERYVDPEEPMSAEMQRHIQEQLDKAPDPPGISVANILDHLSGHQANGSISAADFKKMMFDKQGTPGDGRYGCPGMNSCRIASYQDYIVANNDTKFSAGETPDQNDQQTRLRYTRNYRCCTDAAMAQLHELPGPDQPLARFFCCSNGRNVPGLLSIILNAFLFRHSFQQTSSTGGTADWVVNINYLKTFSCQNGYFGINRLFGVLEEPVALDSGSFPVNLIRILPVGGGASLRLWYHYALELCRFLRHAFHADFSLQWEDAGHCVYQESDEPDWTAGRETLPAVLAILRRNPNPEDITRCPVCGVEKAGRTCRTRNIWS